MRSFVFAVSSLSTLLYSSGYLLLTDHAVGDLLGTVAGRKCRGLANRTQAAVLQKEEVDTLRVENVSAWEFPDCRLAGDVVIETNYTGGLGV